MYIILVSTIKRICFNVIQFRDRLRQAHEAFLASLRELESVHTGRLEKNEEMFLRLRKILVPRVARLALESTSLKDMILYGMMIFDCKKMK